MNHNDFQNLNFSFLGRKNFIKGDFKLHGDMIINCALEGTINMETKSLLTFDREASFQGTIHCHDLEVFGNISGNISATGSVTVRASAQISGKVQAQSLKVYPGALLNIEGDASPDELQETLKS